MTLPPTTSRGPQRQKPVAIRASRSPGAEVVTGDLEREEAIVGQVGVERPDDPVAIAPGVGALGVELEAVGVGVMRQVEPVLAPALAVMRAGQQAIDQPFVGIRAVIAQEGSDLVGRRAAGRSGRTSPGGSVPRDRPRCEWGNPSYSSPARMNRSIGFVTQRGFLDGGRLGTLHGLIGPMCALVGREGLEGRDSLWMRSLIACSDGRRQEERRHHAQQFPALAKGRAGNRAIAELVQHGQAFRGTDNNVTVPRTTDRAPGGAVPLYTGRGLRWEVSLA